MSISIFATSLSSLSSINGDRILRLDGGFYVFDTAAERRRIAKLLKRGLSFKEALKFEGPLDPPKHKQKAPKQERMNKIASELEAIYKDPCQGLNEYDAYQQDLITYDQMSAPMQEFHNEAYNDGFYIFGSYDELCRMYDKASQLNLWKHFNEYLVSYIVTLENEKVEWLISLGLYDLEHWNIQELLSVYPLDIQKTVELYYTTCGTNINMATLVNYVLPEWVNQEELRDALYYTEDVVKAVEYIIDAYENGWDCVSDYDRLKDNFTAEEYYALAEVVDVIYYNEYYSDMPSRVITYKEMLLKTDLNQLALDLYNLIYKGVFSTPKALRGVVNWNGTLQQSVIDSWNINTVDDLFNNSVFRNLQMGIYDYSMRVRLQNAIEKAVEKGLLAFESMEEALHSELVEMIYYQEWFSNYSDFIDEEDNVNYDLLRDLPCWLTNKLYQKIRELFIQPSTPQELLEHPVFQFCKEKKCSLIYSKLNQRFNVYDLMMSFEEQQKAYLSKKMKELLNKEVQDSWFFVNSMDIVLPELKHFLEEVKAVLNVDYTSSIPMEMRVDLNLSSIKTEVKEETEVIPYFGHTAISCSKVSIEIDTKWSREDCKIWASPRGLIESYGENAVLTLINTRNANRIDYTHGSWNDNWSTSKAYGISPNYDTYGGMCFENSLVQQKLLLGNSRELDCLLREGGLVKVGEKTGWAQVNNSTWQILFEDGCLVKGSRGLPELAAYAKGLLTTEKEAGLPLAKLFLVRLVLIALGAAKKHHSHNSARAAGYEWLGHYALGTGANKQFPAEWLEPIMNQIKSNTDSDGHFFVSSDAWNGRGFEERPHGFYTIGGFSGHYNHTTGELQFEDVYDWHPMTRTSPTFGATETVWCWSEFNFPTISLEELAQYLPKKLQPFYVKSLQRWGLTEISLSKWAEQFLGPQYIGESDFFGVYGVSNKLWHDLEKVGAKPFKTVFKNLV